MIIARSLAEKTETLINPMFIVFHPDSVRPSIYVIRKDEANFFINNEYFLGAKQISDDEAWKIYETGTRDFFMQLVVGSGGVGGWCKAWLERSPSAEVLQHRANAPLRPRVEQNLICDHGLFGDSHLQAELFSPAKPR